MLPGPKPVAIQASLLIGLLALAVVPACGERRTEVGQPATSTLTPGLPSSGFAIKSAGEVLAVLPDERVKVRIDRGNQGTQALWDTAIVLLRPAGRLVFTWTALGTLPPGVSANKISDLRQGERISFVLHPDSKNPADGSYEVSVIGRAAP